VIEREGNPWYLAKKVCRQLAHPELDQRGIWNVWRIRDLRQLWLLAVRHRLASVARA
jgi:hypothetical protein